MTNIISKKKNYYIFFESALQFNSSFNLRNTQEMPGIHNQTACIHGSRAKEPKKSHCCVHAKFQILIMAFISYFFCLAPKSCKHARLHTRRKRHVRRRPRRTSSCPLCLATLTSCLLPSSPPLSPLLTRQGGCQGKGEKAKAGGGGRGEEETGMVLESAYSLLGGG